MKQAQDQKRVFLVIRFCFQHGKVGMKKLSGGFHILSVGELGVLGCKRRYFDLLTVFPKFLLGTQML